MNRWAALQEFSQHFERQYRRGKRCTIVIPVTDLSPDLAIIGWLEGAMRTILDVIQFRFHRD